jgi:anti-sigma factor RsiW
MRWRRSTSPAAIECQELVEHVTDYLDGALSPELRARIDHHLADCEGCTEFLRQMRQTVAAARGADIRRLDAPVRASLLEAFRSQKGRP